MRVSLHIIYQNGTEEVKKIEMTVGYKPQSQPFYLDGGCIVFISGGKSNSLICGVRHFFIKDLNIRDRHAKDQEV